MKKLTNFLIIITLLLSFSHCVFASSFPSIKGKEEVKVGTLSFTKLHAVYTGGLYQLVESKNAKFSLYKYDDISKHIGSGQLISTQIATDKYGSAKLEEIKQGKYYLVEDIAADNSLIIPPEMVNSESNRLLFNVDGLGKISYPENSIFKQSTIIKNYPGPKIEKKKEFLNDGNIKYKIYVTFPVDIDKYNDMYIEDIASNIDIDFLSIRIDSQQLNRPFKLINNEYINDESIFTIKVDKTSSEYTKLAGKTIEITYNGVIKDKTVGKYQNKASFRYIDPFGEPNEISSKTTGDIYGKRFIKIDEKTSKPLEGAEFVIVNKNGEKLRRKDGENIWSKTGNISIVKFISDEDGIIYVDNLPLGTYYIQEVSPPKGYLLKNEPIPFEISNKSLLSPPFVIKNKQKEIPPGSDDETPKVLPQTGLKSIYLSSFVIVALMAIAISLSKRLKINEKN